VQAREEVESKEQVANNTSAAQSDNRDIEWDRVDGANASSGKEWTEIDGEMVEHD